MMRELCCVCVPKYSEASYSSVVNSLTGMAFYEDDVVESGRYVLQGNLG